MHNFSGDFVGRVTPVSIPNTEVKPAGADGTARVTVWESRKSPGLLRQARERVKRSRASSCLLSNVLRKVVIYERVYSVRERIAYLCEVTVRCNYDTATPGIRKHF